MKDGLHIMVGGPEDHLKVVEFWEEVSLSHRPKGRDSPEMFQKTLREGTDHLLLAYISEELVGTLILTSDGRKAWINRLAVNPVHRRKGIASALMEKFEKIADERGLLILCALVEDWNKESVAFFKSIGYVRDDDVIYFSKRGSQDD